jgi:hypothetical protein
VRPLDRKRLRDALHAPEVPLKSSVLRFSVAAKVAGVVRASELQAPPAPMVSCGIAAVDALTGGLPRGALTEICGPASSGRTSLMLAVLAQMTSRNEVCALMDATDAFDPISAAAAGVYLERLLWIRCGHSLPVPRFPLPIQTPQEKRETGNQKRETVGLEQALKATDLLLQGGGFGLVIVDLCDVPPQLARRVPLTSWFRFRRSVEHTPTVLLVLEAEPYAKTCASLVLRTASHQASGIRYQAMEKKQPAHARIFTGFQIEVEVVRSRLSPPVQASTSTAPLEAARKPAQPATATFESKTAFAI